MIQHVIWFVLGCWIAGIVLDALKLGKARLYLAFGGIPFHELSHLAACLALGVKVKSVTLLHVEKGGASGGVEPRAVVGDPFTVAVIALAPGIGAVFWAALFAWGIGAVYEAGADPGWTWLLLYLAVATGTRAAPSGGDVRYAMHAIGQRPGQFLAGLGGSALAGWTCWACRFPVAEWWHLLLLAAAVLGPGVALSRLCGWWRG